MDNIPYVVQIHIFISLSASFEFLEQMDIQALQPRKAHQLRTGS